MVVNTTEKGIFISPDNHVCWFSSAFPPWSSKLSAKAFISLQQVGGKLLSP